MNAYSSKNKHGLDQHAGGKLQPLFVPDFPWQSVSMDFIVQLLRSYRENDAILGMVDQLTKNESSSSLQNNEGTERPFMNHVWNHHEITVSDRISVRGEIRFRTTIAFDREST